MGKPSAVMTSAMRRGYHATAGAAQAAGEPLSRSLTRQDSRKAQEAFAETVGTDDGTMTKEEFEEATAKLGLYKVTKLERSLSRNELSATFKMDEESQDKAETQSIGDVIAARFKGMFEVTISKIFPAGFGWQGASVIADNMGYQVRDVT